MNTVMPTRRLERKFWAQGYQRVAGVDEVGRGPLAGPVTVAAVVLPDRCRLRGVRDSKCLTPLQRASIAGQIRVVAEAVAIGWASSGEIDRLGLTAAMRLAGGRALRQIGTHEVVLLDGNHNYLGDGYHVNTCIKADQTCLAVAAASVIAKVARDSYMELLHDRHPEYGFVTNKGYGTADHLAAVRRFGLTPYHRHRWRSVQMITAE